MGKIYGVKRVGCKCRGIDLAYGGDFNSKG